jgi:hypothetical protein
MSNPKTKDLPCRYLRAKNSFGMLEVGGKSWSGVDDPNAQYWCVRTAGAIGPDNGIVSARVCRFGRKCFREEA